MPIIQTPKELGLAIRSRRKELGWDQATLAKQVGVTRQWVIEIEKGKPRAELALAMRALRVLGLSLNVEAKPESGEEREAAADPPNLDINAIVERNRAIHSTTSPGTAADYLRQLEAMRRFEQLGGFETARSVADAWLVPDGGATVPASPDGHFPASLDRDDEKRLLRLAASGNLADETWAAAGPRFFMAGLAVMLAGEPGLDRRSLLALAERLHPGASEPAVFTRWLEGSPLRPSRFLPLLAMEHKHAA